jgi:hypothetical protein
VTFPLIESTMSEKTRGEAHGRPGSPPGGYGAEQTRIVKARLGEDGPLIGIEVVSGGGEADVARTSTPVSFDQVAAQIEALATALATPITACTPIEGHPGVRLLDRRRVRPAEGPGREGKRNAASLKKLVADQGSTSTC